MTVATHRRTRRAEYHDRAWAREAIKYLSANPLCVECAKIGRTTKAREVDHIEPFKGDYTLKWTESNWQALCKSCQSMKTRRDQNPPLFESWFVPKPRATP